MQNPLAMAYYGGLEGLTDGTLGPGRLFCGGYGAGGVTIGTARCVAMEDGQIALRGRGRVLWQMRCAAAVEISPWPRCSPPARIPTSTPVLSSEKPNMRRWPAS